MVKSLYVFAAIAIVIISCAKQPQRKSYKDIKEFGVFVRNEDTIHKTVFAFRKNQQFSLFMTEDYKGKPATTVYMGKYTEREDTVWLSYRKDKKPEGMRSYLAREISGTYFIQSYTDNRPRMFLRIIRPWMQR